jgi:hypothetical protein
METFFLSNIYLHLKVLVRRHQTIQHIQAYLKLKDLLEQPKPTNNNDLPTNNNDLNISLTLSDEHMMNEIAELINDEDVSWYGEDMIDGDISFGYDELFFLY